MKFLRHGFKRFQRSAVSKRERGAFTLVELLVVIGIIALLISILLPALSSARKQAQAVKCEAALREIGNAYLMYAQDNNGWAPPAKLIGGPYNLYGVDYSSTAQAFWFNFLSKYVTKSKVGYAAGTNAGNTAAGTTSGANGAQTDAADAQARSIFWACPAWQGYISGLSTSVAGFAITQPGIGMNGFPEYTPSWPKKGITLGETGGTLSPDMPIYTSAVNTPSYSSSTGWNPPATGKWYKITAYNHASERCLFGDSLFWFLEARAPLTPPAMAGQFTLLNIVPSWASEADGNNETMFDFYRHGTYPKTRYADEFDPTGGKVKFNVLYADNHVVSVIDRAEGYRSMRMRYPG